jgi:hypothetical protein
MTRERNAWKTAALAATGTALLLGVGVTVANLARHADEAVEDAVEAPAGPALSSAQGVPVAFIERCNQHAAQARRDPSRILRDGVVGGALGAGVGAAGGAIADGGDGAGKGAGIGALVGAAAGTLYGLNEENRKSEQAMSAYQQCMARHGY